MFGNGWHQLRGRCDSLAEEYAAGSGAAVAPSSATRHAVKPFGGRGAWKFGTFYESCMSWVHCTLSTGDFVMNCGRKKGSGIYNSPGVALSAHYIRETAIVFSARVSYVRSLSSRYPDFSVCKRYHSHDGNEQSDAQSEQSPAGTQLVRLSTAGWPDGVRSRGRTGARATSEDGGRLLRSRR
jgi:hypothetical protein